MRRYLFILNGSRSAFHLMPVLLCLLFTFCAHAQKDSSKIQSVEIVSSYKPTLPAAVKINFSGSKMPLDTTKNIKLYNVPAQNLFYAYQPVSLKPLAYQSDTTVDLGVRNYVKAGFGNYTTPYLKAAYGWGDGTKALVNAYGDYISSKGRIKNQDYSMFSLKGTGSYFFSGQEAYASAGISGRQYFLYGYDHNLYDYSKDQVRQLFQEVDVTVGFRNTETNLLNVTYNPNIRVNLFTNNSKLTENSYLFNVPVEKRFGEKFILKAQLTADITNYSTKNFPTGDFKLKNNVVKIIPSAVYNADRFKIHAGIIPAWDNGKFYYLPQLHGELEMLKKSLIIQGGWVGDIHKNTYRNLTNLNPYLQTITYQKNTRETELYAGLKSSVGKHFNFSAKVGFVTYYNYQFFINDTAAAADGKSFLISNENKLNNFKIHADASYVVKEKLSVTAGVTLNGFTGIDQNEKAWHTLPVEITSSLRWWAYKKLLLKSDFYLFAGAPYLERLGNDGRLSGTDLSAGAEYNISKPFSAFLDVNNIFGKSYQRWYRYQVYGLNFVAGVVWRY